MSSIISGMSIDKVDKREHIINTAIHLFATRGFEGSSIRDIAAAAGVNIAMINYYFGSKEKLFEAMVEFKAAYTRGAFDEITKNEALTAIDKVERIIDLYVQKLFSNREFHKVLHHEIMLNQREELGEAITNIIGRNGLIIRGIIEDGMKRKEFKKVDAALTVASLSGTINQILLSRRICNKLLGEEDKNYVPYDDAAFAKRVSQHLKQMMRAHLLKEKQ